MTDRLQIAGQVTPITSPIYVASKHAINGFVRTLAPLAAVPDINVRVTAVAPALIKTPLWTDNPEKMRLIGDIDFWITAEDVADAMVALVEQDEIEVVATNAGKAGGCANGAVPSTKKVQVKGGMVLEVSVG